MQILHRLALAAVVLLAAYLIVASIVFYRKVQVSKTLIEKAEPFALSSSDMRVTLLVLGDSTAVGVGADAPQDTVPGLLAQKIGATYVENRAVSGARLKDIPGQIAASSVSSFDTALLMVGGNDIIRFAGSDRTADELSHALDALQEKGGRVYVMSAGNVGSATLFPWFIRPFHTSLNLRYHDVFARVAAAHGATYVNLYSPPEEDPFVKQPETYLAKDGLHPSSEGYALWFSRLLEVVQ